MDAGRNAALLTAEVVGLVVIALVTLPVPGAVALLVVAVISLGMRGLGFADNLGTSAQAGIGAIAGAVAAVVTLVIAGPLLEAVAQRELVWTVAPIVRGNALGFAIAASIGSMVVLASELALRGWLLPRLRGLVDGRWAVAIAIVAVIEFAITHGTWSTRGGAALVGVGASLLCAGSGGRLAAPITAQVMLQVGLLAVEALKLRG